MLDLFLLSCYTLDIMREKLIINHINNSNYTDLNVISAGFENCDKNKEVRRMHNFMSFSMHFVVSGKGYYSINGKSFSVEKNSIFCIFPDAEIEYRPDKQSPWTYYWINFTGTIAHAFLTRIGLTLESPVINVVNPNVKKHFVQNALDCKNLSAFSDTIALAHLYNVFNLLIIENCTLSNETKKDYLTEAMQYLNNNYYNPGLTLQDLAKYLHLSAEYCSRLLKKHTGMSFTSHLMTLRLKACIALVDSGVTSVSEIAYQTGYSDPYYLSKVFKKYNGESLQSYIRNHTPPPPKKKEK